MTKGWKYNKTRKGFFLRREKTYCIDTCWVYDRADLESHLVNCGITNLEYLECLDRLKETQSHA